MLCRKKKMVNSEAKGPPMSKIYVSTLSADRKFIQEGWPIFRRCERESVHRWRSTHHSPSWGKSINLPYSTNALQLLVVYQITGCSHAVSGSQCPPTPPNANRQLRAKISSHTVILGHQRMPTQPPPGFYEARWVASLCVLGSTWRVSREPTGVSALVLNSWFQG